MMKLSGLLFAGILAVAGTGAAQAQDAGDAPVELDPAQVSSAVRYAMPLALDGLYASCASSLPPKAYLLLHRDGLKTRFTKASEGTWSQARGLIMQLMDKKGGEDLSFMKNMPDDAMKPFVDAMVTQLVAEEIEPAQCVDIDRVMEQLDPLPAENLANLVGVVVDLAMKEEKGPKPLAIPMAPAPE
ncbi:hypothetical protein MKP08_10930 [Erythrobacter sp. LQ02-29]|uniref:hypothetical protein n=1 Tax=Erythrobacter sp. LQ02-29 TaxID=2920384 RepID=UPI001F4E595F|nr:hypothetical protein [Erythrobacter sp. LQ02-29]MCP9223264.1 hypothetical protein [Erythrobacter sp. LQ02-29]